VIQNIICDSLKYISFLIIFSNVWVHYFSLLFFFLYIYIYHCNLVIVLTSVDTSNQNQTLILCHVPSMVHSGIRNYDGIKVLLMEALTATRAGIRSSIGVSYKICIIYHFQVLSAFRISRGSLGPGLSHSRI